MTPGAPVRKRDLLLARLDAIGSSLARTGNARALIGLGSVGIEHNRLDDLSDLDFFVIVDSGHKQAFLDDLAWLGSPCPIDYAFRNTRDGYKVLSRDGVFCEFAVFEEHELDEIPFAPGRIVWKRDGVPDAIAVPRRAGSSERHTKEWSLGEALTNLYVGLCRDRRGEKLSAMRLIQFCAVDRVLELVEAIEPSAASAKDPFARERRCEDRCPALADALPTFAQGYERNIASAESILSFLESRFDVNPAISHAIRGLCIDIK